MRSVRRIAFLCAATLAAVVPSAAVHAQPASAIGEPLPESSLAVGTITVRVVDGSPSKAVVGTDVTLLVNGEPRQARTDAAGRATFSDLPVGGKVQAQILDANQKDVLSSEFAVPAQGGVRVMLSITPFQGMGASPLPAASGLPSAREMSGQPRQDRGEPPGMYTARVTYDNLSISAGQLADTAPPVGTPVFLVGYAADDSVKVYTTPVDKTGVAIFPDLDMSGGTAYYALASLARPPAVDRLVAVGIVLDGQAGARVVLSGAKRDATAPSIDDYDKLIPRDPRPVPAGQVRVSLDGVAPRDSKVSLIDARTGKVLGTQPTAEGEADPTQVSGGVEMEARPDLPNGTVEIQILGGKGRAKDPMPGIDITLVDGKDQQVPGVSATTGADGVARLAIPPGVTARAVLTINGKPMVSQPIDLSGGGGAWMGVTANWPTNGKPETTFTVPVEPGQVFYAQTQMAGQTFRSLPFLHLPETGMHVNVYVFPRTLFRFDTHSFVEDQLFAFQGEMQVTNYSWAPYKGGDDGLVIELPRGHKGPIVGGMDQGEVAVAEGLGFRILRPIPPGGRTFRMGYSMPIEDGAMSWDFKLPFGTWKSEMKIRQTPDMVVKLPDGVRGQTQMATTGEPWFVINDIMLDRGKTLHIEVSGFPAPPKWKKWTPRIAGIAVLLILVMGVVAAFGRRLPLLVAPIIGGVIVVIMLANGVRVKTASLAGGGTAALIEVLVLALSRSTRRGDPDADPDEARLARRSKLLDELVELERAGEGGKRKEQLLAELERVWTK